MNGRVQRGRLETATLEVFTVEGYGRERPNISIHITPQSVWHGGPPLEACSMLCTVTLKEGLTWLNYVVIWQILFNLLVSSGPECSGLQATLDDLYDTKQSNVSKPQGKGKGMVIQMMGTNLRTRRRCDSQHMGSGSGLSEKQGTIQTGLGEVLSGQWSGGIGSLVGLNPLS